MTRAWFAAPWAFRRLYIKWEGIPLEILNRLRRNARALFRHNGGNVLIVSALSLPVVIGVAGLVAEYGVALVERDPAFKTDRLASALFDFGDGRQAAWTTSTQLVPTQRFTILGTKGRITVEIPCNAPFDRPCRIVVDDGRDLVGGGSGVIEIPTCNQYRLQGEMFSKAVRGQGQLAMTMEDSIANMKVLDALFASERSGGWVAV